MGRIYVEIDESEYEDLKETLLPRWNEWFHHAGIKIIKTISKSNNEPRYEIHKYFAKDNLISKIIQKLYEYGIWDFRYSNYFGYGVVGSENSFSAIAHRATRIKCDLKIGSTILKNTSIKEVYDKQNKEAREFHQLCLAAIAKGDGSQSQGSKGSENRSHKSDEDSPIIFEGLDDE